MPRFAVIGYGAMAGYVAAALGDSDWHLSHCIIRAGREAAARACVGDGPVLVQDFGEIETPPDLVVDCAGHAGLLAHGAAVLRGGVTLVSASLGALADDAVYAALEQAARQGGSRLQLVSGAIGGLDALSAARVGGLGAVTYRGSKPPAGWRGSAAEAVVDLDRLSEPVTHFEGSAREAALRYPKNANVAAAVALAGLGFERTRAVLVADPDATGNSHVITAQGAFGRFEFRITGNSLPDTPRSSALAAMSVVRQVLRQSEVIVI